MFSKTKLVVGSIILAVLGFSPMFMTIVGKGNKKDELELNPKYYDNKNEPLFKTKEQ